MDDQSGAAAVLHTQRSGQQESGMFHCRNSRLQKRGAGPVGQQKGQLGHSEWRSTMTLLTSQITQDLFVQFPNAYSDTDHAPYLSSYARIGAFLTEVGSVQAQLAELEKRVESRLLTRLGYDSGIFSKFRGIGLKRNINKATQQFEGMTDRMQQTNSGKKVKKNPAFSKLLTDELTQIEKDAGFTMSDDEDGHPKALMIMPLSAKKFRELIENKRSFKDPTIGADHGEYTHRVQWALIVLGKIVLEPVKVYSMIGTVAWPKSDNFGLWDALVDRQPFGAANLPTWLCLPEQQAAYPLVAGFLMNRKMKRAFVTANDSAKNPLLLNYIGRKIYGRPYDQLDANEQLDAQAFLDTSQQKGVLEPGGPGGTYVPQ
jgi:hypothetical protein